MPSLFYSCDICGLKYRNRHEARLCESRGKPEIYPVGLIYQPHANHPDEEWRQLIVAIAGNHVKGHRNFADEWMIWEVPEGCLNRMAPPRLITVGAISVKLTHENIPDTTMWAFGRMVRFLQERGIEPTMWDGEKPVPATIG